MPVTAGGGLQRSDHCEWIVAGVVPAGRPSMPRSLTVTEVTDTSVSLRWSRPETDGGKPITRYVVEKRDPAKSTYIPVGTTSDTGSEFRVIRLVAGNEYVLRVSAENEVGVGEPAELSQGITAKSPYCKHIPSRMY